jgi:hypothetical protein
MTFNLFVAAERRETPAGVRKSMSRHARGLRRARTRGDKTVPSNLTAGGHQLHLLPHPKDRRDKASVERG